ncbi:MAG: metallopeptidase family protein [Ardenticatenales bacterium]
MRMTHAAFAALVVETIDSLPDRFVAALDNVEFVVEDRPTPRQVADLGVAHADELLGLYEGTPRTALGDAGMRVPDRVTIYRLALLARARSEAELRAQVRRTVLHEIAHVFGIDDDRLVELGAY